MLGARTVLIMNIKQILDHIIKTTDDEVVRNRAIKVLQSFQNSHISKTGFGDRVIIKVQRGEKNDNS